MQTRNIKTGWRVTQVRCRTAGPWNCQATVGRPQWAENSTSGSHTERNSVHTCWNCTTSACIVFRDLWCKLVLAVERLLLEYRQDRSGYGTASWLCYRLAVVEVIPSLDSVAYSCYTFIMHHIYALLCNCSIFIVLLAWNESLPHSSSDISLSLLLLLFIFYEPFIRREWPSQKSAVNTHPGFPVFFSLNFKEEGLLTVHRWSS